LRKHQQEDGEKISQKETEEKQGLKYGREQAHSLFRAQEAFVTSLAASNIIIIIIIIIIQFSLLPASTSHSSTHPSQLSFLSESFIF
jgi:hypothetical protein